jgi:hypothetical protein
MIVFPKREQISEGVYLSLYNKEGQILIRSTAKTAEDVIAVEYDGLVYTSFPQLPDHCFLDYASVVKKFKD